MKNAHLAKSDRNGQMIKQLASGRTQSEVAKEFNITAQRVNGLVQKWLWQGLLERTEEGFAIPAKGRIPAKVIHYDRKLPKPRARSKNRRP